MAVEANIQINGAEYFAPIPVVDEIERLRLVGVDLLQQRDRMQAAITGARAQLYAVHSVNQVPFLKGAIGAALQALDTQ